MFKTLKDVRRRTSQSILATVGSAETTKDEVFDIHVEKFNKLFLEMNEFGASVHTLAEHQKELNDENEKLAKAFVWIYKSSQGTTDWPDVQCKLKYADAATIFEEKMTTANSVIRASVNSVNYELGLDPLRMHVTKVGKEISTLKKERNIKLTDYDSYRRRLKEKEDKKAALETAGKGGTPAAADIEVEIEKFQRKVQNGLEEYMYLNEKVKSDIIEAKVQHDAIIDELLLTSVIAQSELCLQAVSELEKVIKCFPENSVREVRVRMHRLMKAGGLQPIAFNDLASSSHPSYNNNSNSNSGRSNVSVSNINTTEVIEKTSPASQRYVSGVTVPTTTTPTAATTPSAPQIIGEIRGNSNPFGANPFVVSLPPAPTTASSSVSPQPAPALVEPVISSSSISRPSSTVTNNNNRMSVRALYNHDAEEEDELDFKAGDVVEIIEKAEGGWWRGSCRGKEGLFPSNYVQN